MNLAQETYGMIRVLLFTSAFSILYVLIILWILERREKKYRLEELSFCEGFLAASLFFIALYMATLLVSLRWPAWVRPYGGVMALALAIFCLLRERSYKSRRRALDMEQSEAIAALEAQAAKSPGNAACWERLSELYEAAGLKDRALEAARKADSLAPSTTGRWRVTQLEND